MTLTSNLDGATRSRLRDLRHILEIGRMLAAVLTPDEKAMLHRHFSAAGKSAEAQHRYRHQPLTPPR